MKLFVNCRAYAFDPATRSYAVAHAFAVEGSRFAAIGETGAGVSAERVDLGGATVVPAFADCHVHLPETGYLLGERDLSEVRDARAFEARVAALPRDVPFLFAGKLDDGTWSDGATADPAALERHHAGRFVLISRVDVHSCLVNARTFAELAIDDSLAGIERDANGRPTGRLTHDANYAAQERFFNGFRRASAARHRNVPHAWRSNAAPYTCTRN